MKRKSILQILIISLLSFICGAGFRFVSTSFLYKKHLKELNEYMEQEKDLRIRNTKEELLSLWNRGNIIIGPLTKETYDAYGRAFNSQYICINGTKSEKDIVIKDGLSAYTIAMAVFHSLYGNDVVKDVNHCQTVYY